MNCQKVVSIKAGINRKTRVSMAQSFANTNTYDTVDADELAEQYHSVGVDERTAASGYTSSMSV